MFGKKKKFINKLSVEEKFANRCDYLDKECDLLKRKMAAMINFFNLKFVRKEDDGDFDRYSTDEFVHTRNDGEDVLGWLDVIASVKQMRKELNEVNEAKDKKSKK